MFTLKIHWCRYEREGDVAAWVADEATIFVQADQVTAGARMTPEEVDAAVATWRDDHSLLQVYLTATTVTEADGCTGRYDKEPGRLIHVEHQGAHQWFVASHAWLLGPDGRTIERLA